MLVTAQVWHYLLPNRLHPEFRLQGSCGRPCFYLMGLHQGGLHRMRPTSHILVWQAGAPLSRLKKHQPHFFPYFFYFLFFLLKWSLGVRRFPDWATTDSSGKGPTTNDSAYKAISYPKKFPGIWLDSKRQLSRGLWAGRSRHITYNTHTWAVAFTGAVQGLLALRSPGFICVKRTLPAWTLRGSNALGQLWGCGYGGTAST